ncbi:MAG: FAD-dependent oxidoreductase [Chloroflexota bacterium]|nr:FAD-dependent oxidoreductase [Chloroflexota bacterium]
MGADVHFCATCDGAFYRGKDVLVIGGGNSASEESIFLTKFADSVTIPVRGDALSASPVIVEKIAEDEKIDVLTNVEAVEFRGDGKLEAVVLADTNTGEQRELQPDGVFVFVGLSPNTDVVKGDVDHDERGFIVTDPTLETSVPGIFAAGDVRAGSTKQAASAAGEGAAVALAIRRYIEPLASGIRTAKPVAAD